MIGLILFIETENTHDAGDVPTCVPSNHRIGATAGGGGDDDVSSVPRTRAGGSLE